MNNNNNPKLPTNLREVVRMRPGMYVGGTDKTALHHLVYTVMDHMINLALVDQCKHIWLELHDDHKVIIRDDSLGIPVESYGDGTRTLFEGLLETVDRINYVEYEVIGGLHGVGLCVINTLSSSMVVDNHWEKNLWRAGYTEGLITEPLTNVKPSKGSGTTFTFQPDFSIFSKNDFDRERLINRCEEVAAQIANLTITFRDYRGGADFEKIFCFEEGLKTWVEGLRGDSEAFHEVIHARENVTVTHRDGIDMEIGIEVAFQFNDGEESHIYTSVNTVQTEDGGTHLRALKATLLGIFNDHRQWWDKESKEWITPSPFTWEELSKGLVACISIHHPNPEFESPTKIRLMSPEIYGIVAGIVYSHFYPLSYPTISFEKIIKHLLARRAI